MKRNVFIKAVSLVLCLLTLVLLFAACDEKKSGGITTTTTEKQTTTTSGTTGTNLEDLIVDPEGAGIIPKEVDYGGQETMLLLWSNAKYMLFPEQMVDGEHYRNDLYLRNQKLEEALGLTFVPTFKDSHMSGDGGDELYNHALEGRVAYDAICCYTLYASKLALEAQLTDLNALDYPYSAMPWYPMDITEWEAWGRLFFIANNCSIRNILANWVIYANNTMIDDKGLDDIEDVVLRGDWTLAKMKEYSRNWAAEAQSNANKEEADKVYGFTIIHRTSIQGFYHAAGFDACRINSDGEPEYAFFDKADIQLVSGFVDVFLDICDSPEFGYGPKSAYSGNWVAPLQNKNAAFFAGGLECYTYIDEDGTFSIIPMPKLNDEQTSYYGVQNYYYDVWSVPVCSEDVTVGGMIIEATSYDDYTNIAYKFFELDFKYRYSSSDRGVKIFELIRDCCTVDFSRIWGIGSPYNALNNCISTSATKFQLQNTFATEVSSGKMSAKTNLKNLKTMVENLEFD